MHLGHSGSSHLGHVAIWVTLLAPILAHVVHYCKRADFKEPTPSSRLCSKHFSGEQYEIDPVKRARYGYENAQAKLKDGAIPDIPLLNPNEASKTDQRTSVRGAFEKRQRAEVSLLFHILCI